jgi:[ribosomal protein S5]-alanine N-acetyltransferase
MSESRPPTAVVAHINIIRAGMLVLESQVAAHAEEMFAVLADPAIYEFEGSPPESVAWLRRRFEALESRMSPSGEEQWLNWVARLPTGELAGYVQATIGLDRAAHVAYVFGSKFWGRGVGSTAVNAMLNELVVAYGVSAFVATLKASNYRSAALLRRLGFAEARSRRVSAETLDPDEIVMSKALSLDAAQCRQADASPAAFM